MHDLNLTDDQIDEAALHAALADTVADARLEGAARRLWEARAVGMLTPAGREAMEALAGAVGGLEARGMSGRGDGDEGEDETS